MPSYSQVGEGTLWKISWSPDGAKLAVGSSQGIRLYTNSLQEIAFLDVRFAEDLAWSPDGEKLVIGINIADSPDLAAQIWDVSTLLPITTIAQERAEWLSLSWNQDNTRIAVANGKLTIWDAVNGNLLHTLVGDAPIVYSVAWSPDGQYLASQGSNSSITIWDANSYTILRSLSDVEVGAPLVWNSDSLQVAGGNNGTTKIWNAITGQLIKTLPAEGIYMDSLDWQSNVLVNANALGDNYGNSQIYVWDVASGQTLQIIERPSVFTVALNPDGTRLAYGGEGGNVEVIDTPLLSNKPPFANAGPMQIVTASNGEFAQVILDGSGSYDSDGTILDYSWYENDVLIAEGVSPEVTLGLGDHLVTLEVVDNNGANGSDTVTVLVTE